MTTLLQNQSCPNFINYKASIKETKQKKQITKGIIVLASLIHI